MNITVKLNEKTDIFSIISDISDMWSHDANTITVLFDCVCDQIIEGEIFVIISSIINELRQIDKPIIVEFKVNKHCLSMEYAKRIGFFKNLKTDFTFMIQNDYAERQYIEITHLAPSIYNLNDAFLDIFDTHFDLNPESLNSLVFVFDELICNTTRHCQSKNGGYYFCQKNADRNSVEIIIVDSGIGIHKSLNQAFPHYNELTCLEECIKFGVTCGDGRGHGLFFISELLKRNKGEFIAISGSTHLSIKNGEQKTGNNAYWQGTIIKCVFTHNNALPIEQLLEEQNYSR